MIGTYEFWRFAADRQDLFFSKIDPSVQAPDNPIFKQYKFTNVYRACDRVSQYLINSVIYNPIYSKNEEDVIFRILLFKIFNKIETWEFIINKFTQHPTLQDFSINFEKYIEFFRVLKRQGNTIFTQAYMLPGQQIFGYEDKAANYLAMLYKLLIQDKSVPKLLAVKSMKALVKFLNGYPLIGTFLSYQFSVDLMYSEYFNFDENSFIELGPGTVRGIGKVYNLTSIQAKSLGVVILNRLQYNQHEELTVNKLKFNNLFGRDMTLVDLANCMCEFDKYCRVAYPESNSFGMSRIKQNYRPSERGNIIYKFPPKWCINQAAESYMNKIKIFV